MKRLSNLRPTPALMVAMAALVLAMSGAAVALPGKGTVGANDLARGAVTAQAIAKGAVEAKHIARNAVSSKQVLGKSLKGNDLRDATIKAKQVADDTITSQQVASDGLDSSDISDYEVLGDDAFVKVTATEAATEAAAQTAAPETALFSKGQLTIYAKCFRDTGAGVIHGEIYARTTANGAILQGDDNLPAGDATLLNTTTPEESAEVDTQSETTADAGSIGESEGVLIAPDGTDLHLLTHIAVKQGTFAGGNGAFGDGNVCLFGGAVTG
jgi:hypothetical protein